METQRAHRLSSLPNWSTTLPKTTAGSTGDRHEILTHFLNQSCGQFFGNVEPVEIFLSKHAAA